MAEPAPQTILELRDRLIRDGLAGIERDPRLIRAPHKLRGARLGFQICRHLETAADFQKTLDERHHQEFYGNLKSEAYWEHRFATVQIEFIWERLKVAWSLPGPYSARAYLHLAELKGLDHE